VLQPPKFYIDKFALSAKLPALSDCLSLRLILSQAGEKGGERDRDREREWVREFYRQGGVHTLCDFIEYLLSQISHLSTFFQFKKTQKEEKKAKEEVEDEAEGGIDCDFVFDLYEQRRDAYEKSKELLDASVLTLISAVNSSRSLPLFQTSVLSPSLFFLLLLCSECMGVFNENYVMISTIVHTIDFLTISTQSALFDLLSGSLRDSYVDSFTILSFSIC
jgi:hypothetical protein